MLVDPKFVKIDDSMSMVLGIIGDGDPTPRRLGVGVYEVDHFNFELYLQDVGSFQKDGKHSKWLEYPEISEVNEFNCCYGVCDSPDQFLNHSIGLNITYSERRFTVSFSRISKGEQGEGGWRWHKWGPYIGNQDPQCEYLADEPKIQEVYVFHIFECIDPLTCIEGVDGAADIMTLED